MAINLLAGTAFATSVFDNNASYGATKLNDGSVGSGAYWASGNTANGQLSENQVAGISFAADTAVHQVKVYFDYWGKEIVFGYGPTAATDKSGYTVIRRIDTRTITTDDLGVTIGVGKYLTFYIPLYPKSKAFAVFMETTASTGLVNMSATAGKDYAQIRELSLYNDTSLPEYTAPIITYSKVAPASAFGSTTYPSYPASKMIDGSYADGWLSKRTDEGGTLSQNQFAGVIFAQPTIVRKITIQFQYWANELVIGYANSLPATQGAITRIRTIDFRTTTKDDTGKTIARNTLLTFLVPDYPGATHLAVHPLSSVMDSPLYGGSQNISANILSVIELESFTQDSSSYSKVNGTPIATATYVGEGSLAALVDNNKATFWHSADAHEGTANYYCGVEYAVPQRIAKIEVDFARWGSKILIGYAQEKPATTAGFVVIRSIDTNATPLDDKGVAWGSDRSGKRTNTLILPGDVVAKCWVIINLDNLGNPLSDGPTVNTRLTVYEMSLFKDNNYGAIPPKPPSAYVAYGTAFAKSNSSGSGLITNINDNIITSRWLGVGANALSAEEYAGIKFPKPVRIRKMEIAFDSWGSTIKIGYANSNRLDPIRSRNDFTTVRTIDVAASPFDDEGMPWKNRLTGVAKNTIYIEAGDEADIWAVYSDSDATSLLSDNLGAAGANSRAGLRELTMFTVDPIGYSKAVNPQLPTLLPTLPFVIVPPVDWSVTEYAVPGDYIFTPAANTTLLLVVLQAAGSGGRFAKDKFGVVTGTEFIEGTDTNLFNENGELIYAAGAGTYLSTRDNVDNTGSLGANWLRKTEYAGVDGVVGSEYYPNIVNAPSGRSAGRLSSTAGVGFTVEEFDESYANPGRFVDFQTNDGSAIGLNLYTGSYWTRGTGGWYSTNTSNSSLGYLQFQPIALQKDDVIKFVYSTSSESSDRLRIRLTAPGYDTYIVNVGWYNTDVAVSYKIPATANWTIRFEYAMDGSATGGQNRVWVRSMQLGDITYPQGFSGSAGKAAALFIDPKVYKLRVGTGGLGVTGGQTIPANAHSTRGGGGAAGANGGDGVIAIYEFKNSLKSEDLLFSNVTRDYLDTSLAAERQGTYRTNYTGSPTAIAAGAADTYTHKLRARTKNVIVLMCGAGGGVIAQNSGGIAAFTSPPATVECGDILLTANSGTSSARYHSGGYWYPMHAVLGTFDSPDRLPIFSATGSRLNAYISNSVLVAGYGAGGAGYDSNSSTYYDSYTGGAGGMGLVLLGTEDFNAERTLEIQVPAAGYGPADKGQPGAVYIFETESDFAPTISGLIQEILLKDGIPGTTVSTDAQQILLKNGIAGTFVSTDAQQILRKDGFIGSVISTDAQLILQKENDVTNDLQVSHMNVAFIYDETDPSSAISTDAQMLLNKDGLASTVTSTDAQMILKKSDWIGSNVSSLMQQIFMRSERLNTRLTNTTQLLFVSEVPSVFWLTFGTLEYPVKNQLYTSLTARATSVEPGAYIQLEGPVAPGTALYVNDVNVGLSSNIKNGDRVYIVGGVSNYFQTFMNVYTYYTTNGEVTREQVGTWNILQPDFKPVRPRAYAEFTSFIWNKTIHDIATSNLVPNVAKQSGMYMQFVDILVSKIHTAASQLVSKATSALIKMFDIAPDVFQAGVETNTNVPVFTPNNSLTNEHDVTWHKTIVHNDSMPIVGYGFGKAKVMYVQAMPWEQAVENRLLSPAFDSIRAPSHEVLSDAFDSIRAPSHEVLSEYASEYMGVISPTLVSTVDLTTDVTLAHSTLAEQGIEIAPVGYSEIALVEFSLVQSYFGEAIAAESIYSGTGDVVVPIDYSMTQAYFGEAIAAQSIITKAAYEEVDQEFEHVYRQNMTNADAMYLPVSASRHARMFYMDTIATTAHTSVVDATAYKQKAYIVKMTLAAYEQTQAKFGQIGAMQPVAQKTNTHGIQAIMELFHSHEVRPFQIGVDKAGVNSATFALSNAKTSVLSSTGSKVPVRTSHNISSHKLAPLYASQLDNKPGKASLYNGFNTLQEANDFTANFYEVNVVPKFNGYVYTIAVDKSFVCEVYYNGPVSGLMQGG